MKYFRTYWGISVIVAIWLLFASPYFGKGLVPFPSKYLVTFFPPWSTSYGMAVKNNAMPDVITQIYPWKRVTIETWKAGEVPLWNPYSFAGTAQAGNYQSAVFSPVNLLFFILPEIHAWSLMILLQPLLAGIFMFLFLRSLGRSQIATVIGSIAFMFCGFITVWMAYGTLGYAALYLPLVLYGANRHMEGKRWAGPLVSASIALSLLSGHFQISLYVLMYTALYIAYLWWTLEKKSGGRRSLMLLVFLFTGVAIAAPQIFPALAAYGASGRSSTFAKGEIIPWSYLITMFAPDFYGNPVTRNDWFGHYAEWASFVGVTPLLLAILAFTHKRRDQFVWFLSAAFGICLLLALPTPLNDWMYALHIPVLSTSSASRIIILVSFSLAVLSAIGTDTLLSMWQKPFRRSMIIWAGLALLFAVGIFGWLRFGHPLPAEKLTVAVRNSYLPILLLVGSVGIMMIGWIVPKRLRKYLVIFLMLITAFDMFRYASKWMPFDPDKYVYPEVNVLRFVTQVIAPSHARVHGNIGGEVASGFSIPVLEGYDAVYQARYGKFISVATDGRFKMTDRSVVLVNKQGKYTEDILRLLGVRYLMHKLSDGRFPWAYPYWNFPSYHSMWKDKTYEVFENTAAYPRAFLASSYKRVTGDQAIVDALFSPGIDRRETLILEQTPDVQPQIGAGEAIITEYTSNTVSVHTDSPVPKLLFLSDVYDAGWRVTVDGKATKLLRADFDFRAVALSKGTHTVTMRYWPEYETLGFVIAGFGTLWCIGYLLRRKL